MTNSQKTEGTNPLVSVIMPVYNTSPYLRQCMDSILAQTLDDLELICVDDGSTDESLSILNEYRERDRRVQVIQQENSGAGVARNNAVNFARGTFFFFMDSDDYCREDFLEKTVSCAQQYNADVVMTAFRLYNQRLGCEIPADWSLKRWLYPDGAFNWRDNPNDLFVTFHNYPWNKLIRASFMRENNIRFQEIYLTEDLMFSAPALVLASRLACVDEPLVVHREAVESSMSGKARHPFDFFTAFMTFKDFLKQQGVFDELFVAYANWAANACRYNLLTIKDHGAFSAVYELLSSHGLHDLEIDNLPEGTLTNEEDIRVMHNLLNSSEAYVLFAEYAPLRDYIDTCNAQKLMDYLHIQQLLTYVEKAERQEHELEALKQRVSTLEQEKQSIYESTSYRLGNMVVRPLRSIKDHLSS